MSTTFEARPGDTFESIARRAYGTEADATTLREANPGVAEPLTPGTILYAPPLEESPRPSARFGAGEDVAVRLADDLFTDWSEAVIVRAVDAVDTLELSAPFDPRDPKTRARFRPFSYTRAEVLVAGERLFTGTQVGVDPSLGVDSRVVGVSCYALPGVLSDCTMPASAYPIEYRGLDLSQIAGRVCRPFGIRVQFDGEPGPVFEEVACNPGQRVLDFLAGLAQQRGYVIGSTVEGRLAFRRSATTGRPVANLEEGSLPVLSVVPAFSPQQYHSDVTGLAPVIVGSAGSQFTVKNPRLQGTLRPITFSVRDAEGGDIVEAVEAKAARMFANMVSYTVRVCSWRDPAGRLWTPNTTVNLYAPGAMVYAPYEMEVRSVRLTRTRSQELAELNLILPGAYAGQLPESLPWDG